MHTQQKCELVRLNVFLLGWNTMNPNESPPQESCQRVYEYDDLMLNILHMHSSPTLLTSFIITAQLTCNMVYSICAPPHSNMQRGLNINQSNEIKAVNGISAAE